MRRRRYFVLLFALLLMAVGLTPAQAAAPFQAYPLTSFERVPLPTTGVPVATDSATQIAWIKANNGGVAYPELHGLQGNKWGMVYGLGSCTDPVWKLSGGTGPTQWASLRTTGFHAPANLGPFTGTSDSPFVVIDTCTGISVWGSGASSVAGSHVIAISKSFGAFQHASNGLDLRDPHSTSTVNQRSRGNIPDSMLVRDDLLSYALAGGNGGTLGQVLEVFWPATAAGHVSPMVGDEGAKGGITKEGVRIRVKESWTPPAGCTGPGLVIARTLQRYGSYIGDNAGSGAAIKAQQGSTFPGLTATALAPCITWDNMEFIQPGWSVSW